MALTKVTGDFIKDGVLTQAHLHTSHGITTAHIGEGSNLYFTNARVDSRIGDLSTSNLSEGSNLYYTQARFNTAFAAKSTSDLSEGTNLYYTDARVGSYLTTNSYATQSYVNTQVSNLVDSAPSTLDTLNELAAALGDDANFSTTVTNNIATKLPLAGGTLTGNLTISGSNTLEVFGFLYTRSTLRVLNSAGNGWHNWATRAAGKYNLNVNNITAAEITATGASTFSSTANHYSGHFYYDAYDANGNHYPHFLDGSNANGVDINWRLYTGGNLSVTHLWNVTKTEFRNQLHTTVDARAPIYYDRNNTTYFIDPASNNSIKTVGDWRSDSAAWSGEFAGKMQYHSNYWYIQTTNGVFIRNAAGANNITLSAAGNITAIADVRSPLFYDLDNTAYYLDPALTGKSLKIAGGISTNVPNGDVIIKHTVSEANSWIFQENAANWGLFWVNEGGSSKAVTFGSYNTVGAELVGFRASSNTNMINPSAWTGIDTNAHAAWLLSNYSGDFWTAGSQYSAADMRAPIFYDSNNTNYFYHGDAGASLAGQMAIWGGTSGSTGNQLVIGQQSQSLAYTHQDTNIRPLIYMTGQYPALTLNHTVTSNAAHGPTIQFTFNGSNGRQWMFGASGDGEHLDIGYSDTAAGNSNYNPHNGISGYQGTTFMSFKSNGNIGIGSAGDWGVYGGGDPAYAIDTRGTLYNNTDVRAPIFYDSNNTNYYVNPENQLSLKVYGEICNSNVYEGNLQPGALNIGRTDTNYRWDGSTWASDVKLGMLMNFSEYYEIGFHDSGDSVNSFVYYNGTDFEMGRDIGWGTQHFTFTESVRTPIFYDSANTSYYLDPNSTSSLYGLSVNQTISGTVTDGLRLTREDNRTISPSELAAGRLKFGFTSWNNNNGSPYADFLHMRSYTDSSGGNDTLLMVKKANPSGVRVWNQGWGSTTAYANYIDLIDTGSNNQVKTGYIQSNASLRAPIFYDSNSTSYYVDPATGSNLKGVVINTTSTSAVGNQLKIYTTSHHQYPQIHSNAALEAMWNYKNSNAEWYVGIRTSTQLLGNTGFHFYNTSQGQTVGGWDINGHSYSIGSSRAPIFYDTDDTGYYANPAGTSNFFKLETKRHAVTGTSVPNYPDVGIEIVTSGNGVPALGFHRGGYSATTLYEYDGELHINAWVSRPQSGKIVTTGNISSTIYSGSWMGSNFAGTRFAGYSTDGGEIAFLKNNPVSGKNSILVDGSYYAGENGGFWSVWSGNNYNNRVGIYGDTAGNLQIGTSSTENTLRTTHGYVQVGPMNSSHAHLYTDRSNFYFNKQIQLLGGTLINQNDVQAAIFYDRSDTNKYCDPNGVSQFSGLTVANRISGLIDGVGISGYGTNSISFQQTSGTFAGRSGWHNHLIMNHGDGSSYYNTIISMDFFGNALYHSRLQGGTFHGPYKICSAGAGFTSGQEINSSLRMKASEYWDYNNTNYYAHLDATGFSIRIAGTVQSNYSDIQLKDVIENIPNALDKVNQLNGFYYYPNEIAQGYGYDKKKEVGLSAQDVEAVLPEIVSKAPVSDKYKTIQYERVVPLLVEAIKELKADNDSLRARIETLENQ